MTTPTPQRHVTPATVKAVSILRQLANTAVEQAQLARDLDMPGQGAVEDELAALWRLLAGTVDGGLVARLQNPRTT